MAMMNMRVPRRAETFLGLRQNGKICRNARPRTGARRESFQGRIICSIASAADDDFRVRFRTTQRPFSHYTRHPTPIGHVYCKTIFRPFRRRARRARSTETRAEKRENFGRRKIRVEIYENICSGLSNPRRQPAIGRGRGVDSISSGISTSPKEIVSFHIFNRIPVWFGNTRQPSQKVFTQYYRRLTGLGFSVVQTEVDINSDHKRCENVRFDSTRLIKFFLRNDCHHYRMNDFFNVS